MKTNAREETKIDGGKGEGSLGDEMGGRGGRLWRDERME
jgi:hypothetical protein